MGGIVSGVLGPFGSCFGTCAGSCFAAGFCKLLTLGSTDTRKAATCVLVWVQAVAVLLAITLGKWTSWLTWSCTKLQLIQELVGGQSGTSQLLIGSASNANGKGPEPIGICAALDASPASPIESVEYQLVYRAEAAAFLVFSLILILCISGCGVSAAKAYPLGKVLGVQVLALIMLFMPNGIFTAFGSVAGMVSFFFLTVQSVLFIDASYSLNEVVFTKAVAADRRGDMAAGNRWKVGIIVGSLALLLSTGAWSYWLCSVYGPVAQNIVIPSMFVATVFLIVSITDWCEHGSLLTSAIYIGFVSWLAYEALASLEGPLLHRWTGLLVCALCLVVLAGSSWGSGEPRGLPITTRPEEEEEAAPITAADFAKQSAVQAAASIYIASELAPAVGPTTFVARTAALVVALGLYGWSLIAPKVLRSRDF